MISFLMALCVSAFVYAVGMWVYDTGYQDCIDEQRVKRNARDRQRRARDSAWPVAWTKIEGYTGDDH